MCDDATTFLGKERTSRRKQNPPPQKKKNVKMKQLECIILTKSRDSPRSPVHLFFKNDPFSSGHRFFLILRYPVRVRTENRRIWERGGKSNKRVYRRRLNDKKEQKKTVNKEMRKSLIEHGPKYTIL